MQVAGLTAVTVALPAMGGGRNQRGEKRVRVRPLAGQQAGSPAERAFAARARFATAADAMRSAAARRMSAEVVI